MGETAGVEGGAAGEGEVGVGVTEVGDVAEGILDGWGSLLRRVGFVILDRGVELIVEMS